MPAADAGTIPAVTDPITDAKKELRRTARAARRAVDPEAQDLASSAVAASLHDWLGGLAPGIAAATLATDGEVSVAPVVTRLRALGWRIAYPRIADDAMTFHLVDDDGELILGRWDLLEPEADAPMVAPAELDLVLVPLVAFDAGCHRMGRGKAYYDRAFAFLRSRRRPASPMLVGVAHDVQETAAVPVASHDVRLDAVVTPTTVHGELPTD